MKKILLILFLVGFTTVTQAVNIAHWDFESIDGSPAVDGQEMDNVIPSYFDDQTVNSNHLYNYSGTGYLAAQNVFGNTTLSADKQTSWDGLHTTGELQLGGSDIGALAQWSIEADICWASSDIDQWRTIVGKDGYGAGGNNGGDTNAGLLYFQKTWDNYFKINFVDSADNRWELQSTAKIDSIDTWYSLRAVSDGSTLGIFINGSSAATPLDISSSTDSSLMPMQASGQGWDTDWSCGRGMYNKGHGDKVDGYIDNVVITNVPEPATMMLLGLGSLIMARKRRI